MAWNGSSQNAFGNSGNMSSQAFNMTQMHGSIQPNADVQSIHLLRYYAEQAAMHASRHTHDAQAAARAVEWQQRLAQAAAAQTGPTAVPSNLFGAPQGAG